MFWVPAHEARHHSWARLWGSRAALYEAWGEPDGILPDDVRQDSVVSTSELAFQQLKSTTSMNQTRKPNTIGAANKTSQNYRAGGGVHHITLQALHLSTGRKHQIKSNAALVSGVILSSIA